MKKNYLKPEIKTCKVELADIIATSPGNNFGNGQDGEGDAKGSYFDEEEY